MSQPDPRQKVGLVIDADLWQRFRVLCVRRKVRMSTIVAALVRQWVEEHEHDA